MGYIYSFTEQQAWAIAGAFLMMAFDMLSGIIGALMHSEYQSSKVRSGLFHKALLALVILLAMCIEILSSHIAGLGFGGVSVTVVCGIIIVMEISSVLENIVKAYPELKDMPLLKVFSNDVKGGGDGLE